MQMSAGIADAGMRKLGKDRPTPMPVQALDHATGYLMAAAVFAVSRSVSSPARGLKRGLRSLARHNF